MKYKFRDLATGKIHKVEAGHPTVAVKRLNARLRKKVNYSFLGRSR